MSDVTITDACPQCKASDSIDLSGGVLLCLQCHHEWRPGAAPIAQVEPVLRSITPGELAYGIMHAATVHEVLSEDAAYIERVDEPQRTAAQEVIRHAVGLDWAGMFVRHFRYGTVLVIDDDGGQEIDVQSSDGTDYRALRVDCVLIGDEPVGDVAAALTDDANEPLPQTILAAAGLCLTVALECVPEDTDSPGVIGTPRIGWLPPPCDQVPEAECGVAYAAALLISVFGLDRQQVQRLAANLLTGAEAGLETENQE